MNKSTQFARNGAIIFGLGNAVLNTIRQFKEIRENSTQEFSWQRFLIAMGKGIAIGGAGGYALGAIADHNNSQIEPVNTDALLFVIFNEIKLDKNDVDYKLLNNKVDQLIDLLKNEYRDKLASAPLKGGSTVKETALHSNFDIDIFISFKPNSFQRIDEMASRLLAFIELQIGKYNVVHVRRQGRSLGIFLKINGREYKVDLVPNLISKNGRNKTSGYLSVNKSTILTTSFTHMKTDFHALNNVKLSKTQKQIIILLKNWKSKNENPLSSHLIQAFVLRAYEYNRGYIPNGITSKIIMVIEYIRENIETIVIRSIENTNNILTNIPQEQKYKIAKACKSVIEDYNYQPNSIIGLFEID